MTSFRHLLSATALAAAATTAVLAQPQAPANPAAPATPPAASGHHHHDGGHGHGMREGERWQQRFDRHMTELKKRLQLTAAQESAWTQFVSAMRPAPMASHADHGAMMKLPTPERIDQMRAMRQQHMAQMDQRGEATKAFYNTLTPEQKKRFDEHTTRAMQRSGHGHEGHHGHHG